MKAFGLEESDLKKIQSVFLKNPEVEKVVVYGSRAKGNYKAFSDVDLTLSGTDLNTLILQKIETELDDLLLPFLFDVSLFQQIENVDLVEHIHRVGKIFYEKE
jgi:predicted nucleotidyltransferase